MGSPKRLLISDINEKNTTELYTLFTRAGYHVACADCLKETIRIIQEEKIDVLVMDVEMPEMKGYEAVSIIRSIDPNLILILTAENNSSELESRVRQQKVFYYHVKSFGHDELELAVRNAFERAKHR